MSFPPSFVVWHFLKLLSVITPFLFLFLPLFPFLLMMMMMLNEELTGRKKVLLWFSVLCIAVLWLNEHHFHFFYFYFFFTFIFTRNTADYDNGNTERPISGMEKEVFIFIFIFFLPYGNKRSCMARVVQPSDFFFLLLFSYTTWCCLLNPISKEQKLQKPHKKEGVQLNSLLLGRDCVYVEGLKADVGMS